MTEWHDLQVNEVNRLPLHTDFFAYESEVLALQGDKTRSKNYLSIEGTWKFRWVADADQRPTDCFGTGYDDSSWDEIQVPQNWELVVRDGKRPYGDPVYINAGLPWHGHFQSGPDRVPTKDNHVGTYRRSFTLPASWRGKQVVMHFGSATSCVYVWVNGKFVGYAEDSKYQAEFDITKFVKPGRENLIAMQVFRWSDGTYCEDQDF